MDFRQCIADSNLALSAGDFDAALKNAKLAVELEKDNTEGYYCAGKALMSMGKPAEAVESYKAALKINDKDGNGYFLLGYAQAMDEQTSDALRSLTRAIELNCQSVFRGQIYRIISMINSENGDYHDALINLDQAEAIDGLDLEILEQRAACYASLRDYHQTIFVLNQIKLLKPTYYKAYNLAFNIFMELGIYDEAKAELERAEKYADLTMAYYNDRVAYTLLHDPANDTQENIKRKWMATIHAIDDALKKGKPTSDEAFELYLRAAQLYLSLENPEMAIRVLDAAVNPVSSFNSGFSVLPEEAPVEEAAEAFEELSSDDADAIMQEKWDNGELDDIREDIQNALYDSVSEDPEELADVIHAYLTPEDAIPAVEKEAEVYLLTGDFQMEQAQADMRNSMYIAAYEMLKDYDGMLRKARELQASSIGANRHSGIYYELKVGKYLGKENWEKKYKERINFWTKRMLEDPTDFISASYRIRSYMDIGDFENAEQLCACLPTDVKGPLMDEIQKAKAHGGGEDGGTH